MLSRDFSSINSTSSQLKHKTLPPHIQFVQLNPNNTLEETHYLVQHEEVLPTQKNDSHPILVDNGSKQYTLRIHDSGNDVTVTPLNSFSFKGLNTFNSKYKRPVKKHVKTLLQDNPLLNETDLNETDDPIFKRIPGTQKPISESNQPIVFNPFDPYLQQETIYNISVSEAVDQKPQSLTAITPTPIKSHSINKNIPFFDPSFFTKKRNLITFSYPLIHLFL